MKDKAAAPTRHRLVARMRRWRWPEERTRLGEPVFSASFLLAVTGPRRSANIKGPAQPRLWRLAQPLLLELFVDACGLYSIEPGVDLGQQIAVALLNQDPVELIREGITHDLEDGLVLLAL